MINVRMVDRISWGIDAITTILTTVLDRPRGKKWQSVTNIPLFTYEICNGLILSPAESLRECNIRPG